MSDGIEFRFIGWCKDGLHDKVWTSFTVNGSYYCAWGRRGAKLQFKKHSYSWDLTKLEDQKRNKGYKEVDSFMLFSLFPTFKEKLSEQLMFKTLANAIK